MIIISEGTLLNSKNYNHIKKEKLHAIAKNQNVSSYIVIAFMRKNNVQKSVNAMVAKIHRNTRQKEHKP